MSDERKITIVKKAKDGTMPSDKQARVAEALQELDALECEVGRIIKRIAAAKEILKAA